MSVVLKTLQNHIPMSYELLQPGEGKCQRCAHAKVLRPWGGALRYALCEQNAASVFSTCWEYGFVGQCSQLRMDFSNDSDIVLRCKAKREEVQKIRQVFQCTNTSNGIFLEPRVSCLSLLFSLLNAETGCCNTFDGSECTRVLTVAIERASVT